jgi:hypothetical protein
MTINHNYANSAMHCTLVRNGFCPLCYEEKEQKNHQLPEPEVVLPPVNQMMQKQHLISTTKSLIMKFRSKL